MELGSGPIYANDTSIVNFFGYGLTDTLVSPGTHLVAGNLTDGTAITTYVYVPTFGPFPTINLIDTPSSTPEPGVPALIAGLATTAVSLIRRRRKQLALL